MTCWPAVPNTEEPGRLHTARAAPGRDAGGQGAGDRHVKTVEVEQFLRSVATGLKEVLAGQTMPMVLVGVEHLVAAYREVNTYPNVIAAAVEHNSDQLSSDEPHKKAWPLIEKRLHSDRERVIDRFKELNRTGLVSTDLASVAEAAAAGRVVTLFVEAEPWC